MADLYNYRVTIRTRVDGQCKFIADRRLLVGFRKFTDITSAVEFIQREAQVNGWRDFELQTIGDNVERPLS